MISLSLSLSLPLDLPSTPSTRSKFWSSCSFVTKACGVQFLVREEHTSFFHVLGDGVARSLFLTPLSPLQAGGNYPWAARVPHAWVLIFIQSKRNKTIHSAESKPDSKCKKHRNSEVCVRFPDSLGCLPGGHCPYFLMPPAHVMRNCPSSEVHLAQSCGQAAAIFTLPGSDWESARKWRVCGIKHSPLAAQRYASARG